MKPFNPSGKESTNSNAQLKVYSVTSRTDQMTFFTNNNDPADEIVMTNSEVKEMFRVEREHPAAEDDSRNQLK